MCPIRLKLRVGLCDTPTELARTRWRAFDGFQRPLQAARTRKSISSPGWRNWQTQRTQNPPIARSWGFDPPSRHHQNYRVSNFESSACGMRSFRCCTYYVPIRPFCIFAYLFASKNAFAKPCGVAERISFVLADVPPCSCVFLNSDLRLRHIQIRVRLDVLLGARSCPIGRFVSYTDHHNRRD